MIPTLVSWSGGKDSAMALFELQRGGKHDIRGLITTLNREDGRIAFHGVGRALVRAQAEALALPYYEVALPDGASNVQYEQAMHDALAPHIDAGVTTLAFGDLFLQDIRAYREVLATRLGILPIFPVWGRDTTRFVHEFSAAGFRAVVVSVDRARLDGSFAGRLLDPGFVADLPPGVDPCGENGEFHSFVFDGPNFAVPVAVTSTGRTDSDGYCYWTIA